MWIAVHWEIIMSSTVKSFCIFRPVRLSGKFNWYASWCNISYHMCAICNINYVLIFHLLLPPFQHANMFSQDACSDWRLCCQFVNYSSWGNSQVVSCGKLWSFWDVIDDKQSLCFKVTMATSLMECLPGETANHKQPYLLTANHTRDQLKIVPNNRHWHLFQTQYRIYLK